MHYGVIEYRPICFVIYLLREEMSGLRMLRRPFMGSAFKIRNVARAVNWSRLIFRYSDEKKKASLSSLQNKWADIQSLHNALPPQIKPIDWNYWRKAIKTPGVVDEFKKRYEAESAKKIKISEGDISRRAAEHQAELKVAEDMASKCDGNITTLEKEIEDLEWEKENINVIDDQWFFQKISWNRGHVEKRSRRGDVVRRSRSRKT